MDIKKRETIRALSSPSIFHGAIESSFAGERMRNLWRIDKLNGQMYLLLLSTAEPDLQSFCEQFGIDGCIAETKNYDGLLEKIKNGDRWRFRLTANPTKAQRVDSGRGRVKACAVINEEKDWLLAKAGKNGFNIESDSFDVTESSWQVFYKKDQKESASLKNRNARVSLRKVTYEGILEISDAELFKQALVNGIGRGKAYGMGLLTVMHI